MLTHYTKILTAFPLDCENMDNCYFILFIIDTLYLIYVI